MRWKAVLYAGGLAPLAGCNMAYYAAHNLTNEAVTRVDEHRLSKRLRAEAREAWREVCRQYPARTFSDDFAEGFTDGYADYLQSGGYRESGGVPQPPTVPPLKYRRSKYLSPEGHAQIKEYLAGFKYGADVAYSTGRRQFLTFPVLLPDAPGDQLLNITRLPAPPEVARDCTPPAPDVPPPGTAPPPTGPMPGPPPAGPVPGPAPAGPPGLGNPVRPGPDGAIPLPKPGLKPTPGVPPIEPPKKEPETGPPAAPPGGLKPISVTVAGPAPPPAVLPPVPDGPSPTPPVPDPPAPTPATPDPK